MPVQFLTDEHRRRYGRFVGEPSSAQLARYFLLSTSDLELIRTKLETYTQLGYALQLVTARFLGTLLDDPTDVPASVKHYVARQIGIPAATDLSAYPQSKTRYRHAEEIKERSGYRDFSDSSVGFSLVRFLYTRATLSPERPIQLFDLATAWLVERNILLPGVSVLERLVARVRERANTTLWDRLAGLPDEKQRDKLLSLLTTPEGFRLSKLERLKRAPRRISGQALREAVMRVETIRELGVSKLDLSTFPPAQLKALARYGVTSWVGTIAQLTRSRQIATLLAFTQELERTSTDDVLDLFSHLMDELLRDSKNEGKQARLKGLKSYDQASLKLAAAVEVILAALENEGLQESVFDKIPKGELASAVHTVHQQARPTEDNFEAELVEKYLTVRRFQHVMLETLTFVSNDAGVSVLEALEFLREVEGRRKPILNNAPKRIITRSWQRHVFKERAEIDRRAYTLCALDALQDALGRRDVFVVESKRYQDPTAHLLTGEAWRTVRSDVCRTLDLSPEPGESLTRLENTLDEAYRSAAKALPQHEHVQVETINGKEKLTWARLDKLAEPPSLLRRREQTSSMMPKVDLSDVLLEINARTGFAEAFTHIGAGDARLSDLHVSICAVLLAEACNLGLEALVNEDVPALMRDRLLYVQQNYIRFDTLTAANARLVDAQATLPLAQIWGGGDVASVDGLRFVVPIRTVNAGPNPKYFGIGRGITYINMVSDQFTGLHGVVVPGTLRDSLHILDGLLEQQTSLEPVEIITDTAAYSDPVFGLFWLLGYQFSPALADLSDMRLWRLDKAADYSTLNAVARNRVNLKLVEENWQDFLRIAGSLKLGTLRASDFMRTLIKGDRPASSLQKALAELGKIPKTLFMLALITDEGYRRRILMQRNRHEGRHRLARTMFYGGRGQVRKAYREGQEDQLGALGLVLNVVTLFNTIYLAEALAQLRQRGEVLSLEDVGRLTPLIHAHINFLGRYHFALPKHIERGELRPLREPTIR